MVDGSTFPYFDHFMFLSCDQLLMVKDTLTIFNDSMSFSPNLINILAFIVNGLFTLATFVGDNTNDNNKCLLLALATLGDATEIGSFLFFVWAAWQKFL